MELGILMVWYGMVWNGMEWNGMEWIVEILYSLFRVVDNIATKRQYKKTRKYLGIILDFASKLDTIVNVAANKQKRPPYDSLASSMYTKDGGGTREDEVSA